MEITQHVAFSVWLLLLVIMHLRLISAVNIHCWKGRKIFFLYSSSSPVSRSGFCRELFLFVTVQNRMKFYKVNMKYLTFKDTFKISSGRYAIPTKYTAFWRLTPDSSPYFSPVSERVDPPSMNVTGRLMIFSTFSPFNSRSRQSTLVFAIRSVS